MRSMVWVLLVWGSSAFAEMCADLPKQLSFKGEFGAVSATQPECERLFAVTQYETDHFRVGPTGRTSVLHFKSPAAGAFLNKSSLVGLFGPDCDIDADKKVQAGETQYLIHSKGLVDPELLLATVTLTVVRNGQEVCRGKAEYTGYASFREE